MSKLAEQPDAEGWYDDPDGRKGLERYWNGTAWSGAPRDKVRSLSWTAIAWMLLGTMVVGGLVWWLIFT